MNLSESIRLLAGPEQSPDALAAILGVSNATAYQWLRAADTPDGFPASKSVRGDENRRARSALIDLQEHLANGTTFGTSQARQHVASFYAGEPDAVEKGVAANSSPASAQQIADALSEIAERVRKGRLNTTDIVQHVDIVVNAIQGGRR